MNWIFNSAQATSETHQKAALSKQNQLTKPPGSLGRLEAVAVNLATLQASNTPTAERISISIFAADHGVAQAGVSAFPQSVTAQMVQNFAHGGAAISVLAQQLNADLSVYNLGTVEALPPLPNVHDHRIAAGTQNLAVIAAMTAEQLSQAMDVGQQAITDLAPCDIWLGGEMGIANTTSATALACALLNIKAEDLVGPGTGISQETQRHKAQVIENARALHNCPSHTENSQQKTQYNLQHLGGFEIAALVGAYIAAAQKGLPVIVDGFICTVAALYARALNPSVAPWLMLSHASAEPGHQRLITAWGEPALLQLDMRLGEGSGAAITVPLLRLACALHNNMATFADAGVDNESKADNNE